MTNHLSEEKLKHIMAWWMQLRRDPVSHAAIKSCKDLFQVSQTHGMKMLRNRLLGLEENYDVQIMTLCVLLGHVDKNVDNITLTHQYSKALEICSEEGSKEDFKLLVEIPYIVDRKDLLNPFMNFIHLLGGQVNMIDLIEILFFWNEQIRRQFQEKLTQVQEK